MASWFWCLGLGKCKLVEKSTPNDYFYMVLLWVQILHGVGAGFARVNTLSLFTFYVFAHPFPCRGYGGL
jgi:nitrate reductase gamma subunit